MVNRKSAGVEGWVHETWGDIAENDLKALAVPLSAAIGAFNSTPPSWTFEARIENASKVLLSGLRAFGWKIDREVSGWEYRG